MERPAPHVMVVPLAEIKENGEITIFEGNNATEKISEMAKTLSHRFKKCYKPLEDSIKGKPHQGPS